jgi:hypothetical protein
MYICSINNKPSVNILIKLKHNIISLFCIHFLYCQFIHPASIRLLTHKLRDCNIHKIWVKLYLIQKVLNGYKIIYKTK